MVETHIMAHKVGLVEAVEAMELLVEAVATLEAVVAHIIRGKSLLVEAEDHLMLEVIRIIHLVIILVMGRLP